MRLIRPSTTSSLFFLTLLLIFGLIFLNQKALAHTIKEAHTVSEERLDTMELYLEWIESGEYGEFTTEIGKKAYTQFEDFLNAAIEENKSCLNTPASPTPLVNISNFFYNLTELETFKDKNAQKLSECKAKIKSDYKLAKKYNRFLKYLQIESGKPNVCVKADLGVGTALKAKGFNPAKTESDNPKETGVSEPLQLYICTGNDGLKKVRVLDSSGTRLRLSESEALKPEFQVQNLPTKQSYEGLLEKLNLK